MLRTSVFLVLIASLGSAQTFRVGIAEFSHESNSFNPAKTPYADFHQRPLEPRAALLKEWRTYNDEVSGFLDGAATHGFEIIPILLTSATPKGPVTDDALDRITGEMIRRLKAAKLDGLLLALHGALVNESHPHGDVEIVKRLREAMGPAFPIVVTHDCHANVSPDTLKYTTALLTYKTVPHIDMRDRGQKAAAILACTMRKTCQPVQAIAKPRMMYNIVYHNTNREPMRPITEESRQLEKNPKILAASVPVGYQYADVEWMGPSAIVVTDGDPELARREADRLSDMLWATRDRLTLNLPESAAAVKMAMAETKAPVVLVEMGDNIGGGSAGDATFVLSELVKQKAKGWVVTLAEPPAVEAAAKAGIGGAFAMAVGGKMDRLHGDPVMVRGRVKSLHDGRYMEPEVRHGGGRYFDQGRTAVIEIEGGEKDYPNLLMLTTRRQVPFSLHQLIGMGIYPDRQRILVVKAAVAFRAAYEPIAARIIEVDTGGTTAVNPKRFTYHRVRRPLFGLE